jgi:transcriptional regulator with XRE-family HTH domain
MPRVVIHHHLGYSTFLRARGELNKNKRARISTKLQVQPRKSIFVDSACYSRLVDVADSSPARTPGLPERTLSMSQLVAYNMSVFRKAAGLSQQELGERVGGWSATSVSAAERSWDSKRIKVFDADDIAKIADALSVPLIALFLPPEDHGTAVRYVLSSPDPHDKDLKHLLDLILTWPDSDSPGMREFRRRLMAAGLSRPVQLLDQGTRQLLGKIDRQAGERQDREAAAAVDAEHAAVGARARSAALERQERERHREAVRALIQTQAELERRIDDLRAYERDCRTRLQAFLEGQLLGLATPVLRPQAELAIKEIYRQAASAPGASMSVILLRADGTYDMTQLPGGTEDGAQQHEDTHSPEEGSMP